MAAKLPVMVNVAGWIMYAVAPRSKVPRSSPAISPTPTFCQRTVVVVIATLALTFGVSVIVSWSTVAACAAPISPITIPAAIISFFMTCLLVWFRTSSGPAMDPSVHQSLRPGGLMEPPKCRLMSASSPSRPPAPPAHAGGVRRQVTGRGPVNRPQPDGLISSSLPIPLLVSDLRRQHHRERPRAGVRRRRRQIRTQPHVPLLAVGHVLAGRAVRRLLERVVVAAVVRPGHAVATSRHH